MKQTTKRFLSMITSLAMLVASLVIYFDFIKPAYADLQDIKNRNLSQKLFLRDEQKSIEKVKDLVAAYGSQDRIQRAVSVALPPEEDVSGAIAQVYGIARQSGLKFVSVSISQGTLRDFSGGAQGASFALQKPIGRLGMGIVVSGPYESVKTFLEKTENNIRILDVESISVAPESSAEGKSAGNFNYNIILATYYQQP